MGSLEEQKEKYRQKAFKLVDKYGDLNIVYLRVSTKDKQEELLQLPQVLENFSLEKKKCLIIRTRESAYQIKKDNFRVFNIVKELLEELPKEVRKNIYVWHLNRLYRNRSKLVDFGMELKNFNAFMFSVRQKIISECFKYPEPMNEIMYFLCLQVYGQSAQEESENRSNDVKKALVTKGGRIYSYKGKLYGKKLKYCTGRKTNFSGEQLDLIEGTIIKLIGKRFTYEKIIKLFADKKNLKISKGYISNLKKKHLNS